MWTPGSNLLRLLSPALIVFVLVLSMETGCAYKMGAGLTAGMLDELSGEGQTDGVDGVTRGVVERALLAELGHQLGAGLASGAVDLSTEQRAELELTIDRALLIAAQRTGNGLRTEVSPALREMVRRDIVDALVHGMQNDVGDSMEKMMQRVVASSIESMKNEIKDPELHQAMAGFLRDSVYYSMQESKLGVASISETVQYSLDRAVLKPFENSVDGLAESVADKVAEASRRTENTLKAIILFLGMVLIVVGFFFTLTRRKLTEAEATTTKAKHELQTVDVAIKTMDDDTRSIILKKLSSYRRGSGVLDAEEEPEDGG